MNDRALSTSVRQLGVVGTMYHIEHDRSRTEIERNIIAHHRPGVAGRRKLKPTIFDRAHADHGSKPLGLPDSGITEDTLLRDRGQPVDVYDMIDLGVRRDDHY